MKTDARDEQICRTVNHFSVVNPGDGTWRDLADLIETYGISVPAISGSRDPVAVRGFRHPSLRRLRQAIRGIHPR